MFVMSIEKDGNSISFPPCLSFFQLPELAISSVFPAEAERIFLCVFG